MRFLGPALLLALLCLSCAPNNTASLDELNTRVVTLPGGAQIRAEVMIKPDEIRHGMMFRDALPPARGMLFIHDKPAPYRYWMYNVKVPLDIVFMDSNRVIVEISADTPPCTTPQQQCPTYGGHNYEQFVLELRAGEARRLGLEKGQILAF
jgi:uncharacterized membrane protein (UPF0127 family)